MANEFIARKGLIALDNSGISGSLDVSGSLSINGISDVSASIASAAAGGGSDFPYTGSAIISGSLEVIGKITGSILIEGSGSTLFEVNGSEGQLFSITDSLSGSLFAVSDVSGLPILEVFSDDTVKIGTFNNEGLIINGSNVTASNNVNIQGVLSLPGFNNVSASLAAASAGGDNLGNHTATQDLDLGGNDIINIGNITASGNISSSGNIYATEFYGDGSNLTNIDKPRITYLYTSSISQAPSNAPTGYIDYADDVFDYILVNTSSYNGVDLDGSSSGNDFTRFLYNEIGSILTIRKVGGSDFKSYKVTNVTTGGNSVRYDITSLSYGVSSGSISNGDEVEFIWDKSAGIGGAYGPQEGPTTKALANFLKPGYNYLDMFFGPQADTEFDGSPAAISTVNSSGSFGGVQYFLPAISQSANLTVNSITGSLVGTASYALTASYVEGGGVTINNNVDNRIITATGTANTLNGEDNFTINSGELNVSANGFITFTPGDSGSKPGIYYDVDGELESTSTLFAGTTVKVGGSISTVAGKIYNLSGSWAQSDAMQANTSTGFLGVALDTATTNTFLKEGVFSLQDSNIGGSFIAGAPLYLSTTTGAVSFNPPSGSGEIVRIAGHALDSYTSGTTWIKIYFNPSHEWIELN